MPAEYGSAAQAFEDSKTSGPINAARGDEVCGDLNIIKTTVTLAGDESTSTVIKLTPPVRQGQVIVPALSYASVPATAATTLTGKIGYAGDDDALASGINLGSAGVKNLGAIDTDLSTIPVGEQITLSFSAASSPNANAKVTFYFVTRSV